MESRLDLCNLKLVWKVPRSCLLKKGWTERTRFWLTTTQTFVQGWCVGTLWLHCFCLVRRDSWFRFWFDTWWRGKAGGPFDPGCGQQTPLQQPSDGYHVTHICTKATFKRERVRMNARFCTTLAIYRYFMTDPRLNCNLRMPQTLTDLSSSRNWCQEIRAEDH